MKKSKKLITIFVIALVLALCVSTFAACGAKKMSKTDFEESIVNSINNMFPANGYYFGIDAAASVTYVQGKDTYEYNMVIQGTLDTNKDTDTADNQMKIELNQSINGAAPKVLLGLYYKDNVDQGVEKYGTNAPKLFINLNDQYKFAYNTYSIKKLVKDFSQKTKVNAVADEQDTDIVGTIMSGLMLMAEEDSFRTKTVKKEVFLTCKLNPQPLITSLLKPLIEGNAGVIDGVLGGLGSDLTAEKLANIDLNIPMTLTIRQNKVKKGQTPKVLGGSLVINIDKDRPLKIQLLGAPIIDVTIPKSDITVTVDKADIISDKKIEITTPSASDGYLFINPLNLNLEGKMNITDSKGVEKPTEYDIQLNVNANPIPVAYLGPGSGWDLKEAVFKNLGMIHLSIISPDRKTALIDIAYDPKNTGSDSVFASLNLGSLGNVSTQLSPSALEGLMSDISAFVNKKGATSFYTTPDLKSADASILTNQADEQTDWLESLKEPISKLLTSGLMSLLKSIPGLADNLPKDLQETLNKVNTLVGDLIGKDIKVGTVKRPTQENFFMEFNIINLANKILGSKIINIDDGTMGTITKLLDLVKQVLGGDVVNIEMTKFGYGTVSEKYNATIYFGANGRSDNSFIRSIDGFAGTLDNEMKNGISAAKFKSLIDVNKISNMSITNYKGGKGTKALKSMIISGFDKDAKGNILVTPGKRTITIGFMDSTGLNALETILGLVGGFIQGDPNIMNRIPFGLVRYTFEVNITA